MSSSLRAFAIAIAVAAPALLARANDPFASSVVSYAAGANVFPGYDNPLRALGEPTRFSPDPTYPAAVTPFSPPWLDSHIVSIGPGGHLTVQFTQPVTNNPLNPFGIDLLIFGNAGLIDTNWPSGTAGSALFGAGNGLIEVSPDGSAWHAVPVIVADAMYPTLGYLDLADPYSPVPGTAPSDFTRPVDPAFSPFGLSYPQIVAGYAGSGGGTGVDIGALGLSTISFVRISNPAAAQTTVDIDAFARVQPIPSPAALALFAIGGIALLRRRRA
jgi:MYXO-CTERM domain-containing protein